ncbi:hypothetical protein Nepgr_006236 [Nepenthes gracilis]|uniref:Uncharacterized protein n=1 Tax=Nepenthes gracilis TaxID=150966 RepID=A0AAD3S5A1_NEPGR|nr:hypothetical protein Nepgr_006236 [Nepenthes gracilis]
MRPTTTTNTAAATSRAAAKGAVDGGFRQSNSPVPYLFGGLAVMLGLIAVALIILACSYWRSSSGGTGAGEGTRRAAEVDSEPKIVVIMAGDEIPTYLAKPLPAAIICQSQQV